MKRCVKLIGGVLAAFIACDAMAAAEVLEKVQKQPLNTTAIVMFLAFVVATLGITFWAASKTKSMKDFYNAGGGISGFQNGLALAGDYMSAAALLGVTSMIFFNGYDGMLYAVSFFVAWPLLMFLFAERIRNLGQVTIADIASFRLDQQRIRTLMAFGSLTVVCFYLVVQMVGAGQLIQLLFGLQYNYAVIVVGALMAVYVTFGGMVATTWVQIIKAVLMLFGATLLAVLALSKFGFSIDDMFAQAIATHKSGAGIMLPSKLVADPFAMLSLSVGLVFGTSGLPHILMRFFTVPDAKAARKSVFVATGFIGYFFLIVMVLGTAAIVIVGRNPSFYEGGVIGGKLIGGGNMPVMHLAKAMGGDLVLGFLSAVAFATILAVVAGLTMAGTSAISHDLYAMVIKRNRADQAKEKRVSRIASIAIACVAILLGIVFKDQNVAFLVALTFSVAASVNFPILTLAIYWKGLTTRGALMGGIAGLVSAVGLVVLSPAVWVKVLGHATPIFPYDYPAIISMTIAFFFTWIGSVTDQGARAANEREQFDDQFVRAQTGIGSSRAASH
ncbi:cation acetate symporter [Paraburkholderia hospita]|jgi:cation/acetate symporter|uniref:Cation/acetate symporter ActP n=1 Tax=Paraburkholderia hospita TaxID=169430 RepID=A0AAJ4SVI7_9BURK|nr:cation acetate symporter [Paraburkholderia hospita]SOE90165.1 transporter, SSS family [Burkholderia sp. YR290]AUT73290.1 cation acetate symporter [Paraburkholderia hospita]AXF04923.1 cation acetate symporter [Paraburkholderia hospita]EIM98753.1 SSS family solute/sodium (Na+) symporter [Paraburkholderia hospita]OUL93909.1 cation acetate symporter [Paraburkholderia hospita]